MATLSRIGTDKPTIVRQLGGTAVLRPQVGTMQVPVATDAALALLLEDPTSQVQDAFGTATTTLNDTRATVSNLAYEYNWIYPQAVELATPYARTIQGGLRPDDGLNLGRIVVTERVHATGAMREYDTGRTAPKDDHCSPAVHFPVGRLPWLVYQEHGGNRFLRFVVGTTDDVRGFLPKAQAYQTYPVGFLCSYAQIHHIPALSTSAYDYFWIIYRVDDTTPRWAILPAKLDQATRVFTWGTQANFMVGAAGIYCTSENANVLSGNQRIRVYMGHNPGVAETRVFYLEFDPITGSVYAPGQSDTAIANVGDFTATGAASLPIDQTTLTPLVAATTGGDKRRTFAGRAGPLKPAVLTAEWPAASPDAGVYKVTELKVAAAQSAAGLYPFTTGYAQTPHQASWNDSRGFELDVYFKMPAVATNFYVARQFIASNSDYLFNERVLSTGLWGTTFHGNTGAFSIPGTGTTLSAQWGNNIVLRIRIDMNESGVGVAGGGKLRRYIASSPAGPFTEQGTGTLVSTASGAGNASTSLVATDAAPLIAGTNEQSQNKIPVIYSITYRTLGAGPGLGTVKASVDFASGWTAYSDTYADPQGNAWTTEAGAQVANTSGFRGPVSVAVPGTVTPGARVGYLDTSNYLGGGDFPRPATFDELTLTDSDGSTDRLVSLTRDSSTAYVEDATLVSQPTSDGRLFRPLHPVNAGVMRWLYLNVLDYSPTDFTEFTMNSKAVLE